MHYSALVTALTGNIDFFQLIQQFIKLSNVDTSIESLDTDLLFECKVNHGEYNPSMELKLSMFKTTIINRTYSRQYKLILYGDYSYYKGMINSYMEQVSNLAS